MPCSYVTTVDLRVGNGSSEAPAQLLCVQDVYPVSSLECGGRSGGVERFDMV